MAMNKQKETDKLCIYLLYMHGRIPTVKLKIPGKSGIQKFTFSQFKFFTFFHGCGLAKSQSLPLVDS